MEGTGSVADEESDPSEADSCREVGSAVSDSGDSDSEENHPQCYTTSNPFLRTSGNLCNGGWQLFSIGTCCVQTLPTQTSFWLSVPQTRTLPVLHEGAHATWSHAAWSHTWPCRQGPQGSKVKFDTEFSWSDHVARLSDRDFKLRYRLTLPAFNELLEMLRPHLKVQDEDQARIAKWGELITEEAKLACALRYLAGGDVKDLQLIYHFSPNHVYKCI